MSTRGRPPKSGRTNLPGDVTPFIGRERELAELQHAHHDTRLLSLLGPAGIGKTRLAVRLATVVQRQFSDGVWLVRLGPVAAGTPLPGVIAGVMGIPEAGPGETLGILEAALRPRRVLLVLDGCEKLLDQVAVVVDHLLQGCPELTVLATSRERIGLVSELLWRVQPLEVPQRDDSHRPDELARVEAVALFVDRARRVNPHFAVTEGNAEPIGELMRRLDGIPLAVELGAAWMETVSPDELVRELDDRYQILAGRRVVTEPNAGLWAAIESGYERLDPAAQSMFSQLGVFAGGWNLGAMTAVCRVESGHALGVLGRLVDHSFVGVVPTAEGPTRYRLLEVLRRFALDRLEASGQLDETRMRFADHFVTLAETASPSLASREGPRWLATLDAELNNVRAVFSIEAPWAAERQLRLAVAMVPYWHFRGLVNEGRLHLRQVVRAMDDTSPAAVAALNGLSWLSWAQGDLAIAARRARAAYRRARQSGDRGGAAYALLRLAQAQFDSARPVTAGRTTVRAERIAAGLGDDRLSAECSLQLGQVALVERRLDDAERLLTESVELLSLAERVDRTATALLVLGRVHLQRGRVAECEEMLLRSLRITREFAMVRLTIPILESLAAASAAGGDHARAARLAGAAAGLLERIGARPPATAPMRAALVARWEPALQTKVGREAYADGRTMDLPRALAYALKDSPPTPAAQRRASGAVRELLTSRQLEVARLLADGLSHKQVASRLGISERTAEGHVEQIFNKLGFNSRAQLVAWIVRHDAGKK